MEAASAITANEGEFTRVHELIYELRIEQVMTTLVHRLRPDQTLREAKEMLRVNRVSGAPVVEGDSVVGMVSVEDIIMALEAREMDLPVGARMTRRVITAKPDESVVQAVNRFAKTRLGRLPVVDAEGQLVGIITRGDVVRGLLRSIDLDYRQEEVVRHRARHVFEDLVSDRTSVTLRYEIAAQDLKHGGTAASQFKRTLGRLGVDPRNARRAAIAAYESEMNIVLHTACGGQMVAEILPDQVTIQAMDRGPGIPDLEKAMQPGYSTAPEWIRELGFGAGMGLANIKNSADQLRIDTAPGKGTHLHILIHLRGTNSESRAATTFT